MITVTLDLTKFDMASLKALLFEDVSEALNAAIEAEQSCRWQIEKARIEAARDAARGE